MKKLSTTIILLCLSPEENIKDLLNSILKQKSNYCDIVKIIYYSGTNSEDIVKNVSSIKNRKLTFIKENKEKSLETVMQEIINKSESDIFVVLKNDISINSSKLISHLIEPFIVDRNIYFVEGNIKSKKPNTLVGKAVEIGFRIEKWIALSYKNGDNLFTVKGEIFAFRKALFVNIDSRKIKAQYLDTYLYLGNLKEAKKYKFVKNSEVTVSLPETVEDFRNQEKENRTKFNLFEKHFRSTGGENWYIPKRYIFAGNFLAFLRHPFLYLYFELVVNQTKLFIKIPKIFKLKLAMLPKNI